LLFDSEIGLSEAKRSGVAKKIIWPPVPLLPVS